MKQALDFLKSNNDIALATVGLNGRPMIRAFQIMKADGNNLYFATNPRKAIWQELQTNPAIELLALKGNISVRVGGDVSFSVPDGLQQEIYNTNPVLQRLSPDYRAMTYFSMEIEHLDYYDLTPTPPILRHYDKASGQYQNLDPYRK